MKIYNLFEEKDLKKIERTVILEWNNIQQLGNAITDNFVKDENQVFNMIDQNSKEVIEFLNYCRSHYELLEAIQILLKVTKKNSHEIEKIIVQKLIDYIAERLFNIKLICKILENGIEYDEFCIDTGDLLFDTRINLSIEEV